MNSFDNDEQWREDDTAAEDSEVFAFPASFAQQRLWFIDQLMPGSPLYNIPIAVRMQGDLHVPVLQASLNEIIARHEVLRTTFETEEGQLMQVVPPASELPLPILDLTNVGEAEKEQRVQALALAEGQAPFDLEKGPLVRATLLQLDAQEYVLLFTMHHIISDGWSVGVLIGELVALYEAFLKGQDSPLPELELQYADFTLWQQEWMEEGEALAEQLSYWKEQLSGELPVLQLPTDYERSSANSFAGAKQYFALPKALSDQISAFSKQQGATLFMTLLTAFNVLMNRYTGVSDLMVGSPIANRNRAEIEALIGLFVNTLVLRTDLSGNPTVTELLKQVQGVTLDAYSNQDVPFEKLVEEIQPDRNLSQNPLFQVMFVLQNAPMAELQLTGLTLKPMDVDNGTAKLDLMLTMQETAEGLTGFFEYRTDLFAPETITRLTCHLQTLLEQIVKHPSLPISDLQMITDAERHLLLDEWNQTDAAYPQDGLLHRLFEDQVEKTPDAVALIVGEERLTYRELNERANRLAHVLQSQGVGPDRLVGVYMERTADLVTSLLAVLKAGGAYVPLDPTYPKDRIAYTLEDGNVVAVLTQSHLAADVAEVNVRTICFDLEAERIAVQPSHNPTSEVTPRNLSHVIYTSGSTGRPKGVAIEHHSPVTLVHWAQGVYSRDELQGVLMSTSICFDLSVYELFLTLSVGGKVILAQNALHLPQLPARDEVTLINTVPSAINELVRMEAVPSAVRVVNLAGEPLSNALAQKIYGVETVEKVYNLYGPSEDTTYSTYTLIEKGATTPVHIGRPLANTKLYVLDPHMQPVPVGVLGELYISGDGLARGYLNREDLTAEKFIPNPFAEGSAMYERMYKTGDVVRYLPDRNVDYLGRIDHQVKIRGFRIELGEIENVIRLHPSVGDAIVMAREDEPGDKRIVAYVVPQEGASVDVSEVRLLIKGKLPEYMMPSAILVLDTLPLTPNGKLDRKALPAPDLSQLQRAEYVAPSTAVEEIVADIFSQVLRADRVGATDNFFDLGGHSLLATQVMSRLQSAFGRQLPLRLLFEDPTVASLARTIEDMQKVNAGDGAVDRPILPVAREGELPLSFAQQRLWMIEQLTPGTAVYNMPYAVRLNGELNKEALERSVNEIVRRHEVLRTTFADQAGQPLGVVTDPAWITLPCSDLRHLPVAQREEETMRLVQAEANLPFDLSTGPLIRFALVQRFDQEHVLLLTMHHIVSDGWSMGVLIEELSTLYAAYATGQDSPLAELAVQYADFAHWQREWLQGDRIDQQLTYWKEQLGGDLPVLQLPTDHPRPPVQTHKGASETFLLPPDLQAALQEVSKRLNATMFMTLLGAFQTLLFRYSGQADIAVGTPIAGRSRQETEALIGFFINTLVMRTDLSNNPTFADLVGRVKDVALSAYAHQDIPFEKLVEELQPERDLSRSPFFQVMFVLQNAPLSAVELPNLTLEPLEYDSQIAKFDLLLSMMEREDGLYGMLEYNTDLFDKATIERMIGHLTHLLRGIAVNPAQQIVELPMLSDAERAQLLVEWNDTALEVPQEKLMHQLFEEQVLRTPDRIALIVGEQRLTYRELNERVNRLAHVLQGLGVGPDRLVGVYMERTIDLVTSLLAVLKAGGAYVPLDPTYPKDRIAYTLEDGNVVAVLTQSHLAADVAEANVQTICLDLEAERIAAQPPHNPTSDVTSRHLSYVIYTSGSTGRPKGVAIEHHSAVTLIHWAQGVYAPDELQGVLMSTSICFDLSVYELFVTLAVGGKVILADNALHLPQLPAKDEVTLINTVPSAINELLRMEAVPSSVRVVNLAGEPLSNALAQKIYGVETVEKVYNLYGPSEDTTYSTYTLVEKGATTPVTIGRPLANTHAYLLDTHMQPVPIGVLGELYLSGDGLARGYLNREDLTAEKFIANPFAEGAAMYERMYRTGDVARYLPDGNIEYLGRIDHQVKVRGFRIELGEIENVIRPHPAVGEAIVMAREDELGDKRIVAYVVPKDGASVDVSEVRLLIKGKLPDYMMPSAILVLESLPLTPNGKLDRKALPAPDLSQMQRAEYVAPSTAVEEIIAGIFSQVLRADRVGTTDNFFDLGGHSLLATQVMSRLQSSLGRQLPLRLLFEAPTVAEMAEQIEYLQRTEQGTLLDPIERVDRSQPLPLSFAQQRLWVLEQLNPGSAVYNIPLVLRLQGTLDVRALEHSLNGIIERHETLRTSFAERDGEPVQVISEPEWRELVLIDLEGLEEQERAVEMERRLQEEANQPFDLLAGSLMRFHLLRLSANEHLLVLTFHHIISDGWSMGVLAEEFAALYTAFVSGETKALPELSVQYADYANWQRGWLNSGVLETQLAYWEQQLAGELPVLQLPTDHPRPAVQSYRGAVKTFELPMGLGEQLQALSQDKGATLFMTLLAAFQTLLYRYTGQEDIIVGTPIAGRSRQEAEGLIGFFVNTLVLRTDLSGTPDFAELLARVRETALGAYAHQDVPFEKLVEELQPERDMSRTPLFQAMFSLQNAMGEMQLPDLALTPVEQFGDVAKFELSLFLREVPNGLAGSVEYNTDLFDEATIERMIGHFATLLQGIAANPAQRIVDLPMLSDAERAQLLVEWNDTALEVPQEKLMHQLFEEQVLRTPDSIALIVGEQRLTYRELNERVNRLAHVLQGLGVGPDRLVGVYMERTADLVTSLLAVLKAGGAYVPLDPTYPKDRIAYTLEDGNVVAVLTQSHLAADVAEANVQTICLDLEADKIAAQPSDNPTSNVTSRHLSYVIYTSGSTGRPKGVAIEHHSAVTLIHWAQGVYATDELQGVLMSTSICFDLSVYELFVTLATGGKVILADNALHLPQIPAKDEVTLINTVPSAINELLRMEAVPSSVRVVNLAGEPLSNALAQKIYGVETVEKVYNLYGPSEDTTYSTYILVEKGATTPVTIGRPLANTHAYLLDAQMQPVPVGVLGELYLSGDGLARGYLNREDLTAEKFIPNPFADGSKTYERMYKTGDVGRYLPDGNIDYLGRIDHQVKVRGFRIELGEIESVIRLHPSIGEAVVMVREDEPGDKRIVAYVVPQEEASVDVSEVRLLIKGKLPEYMMPSAMIVLDTLPLTPNGKLDRKALPAPDLQAIPRETKYMPARDNVELKLVRLWEELLNTRDIGVRDNFFDVGGHSLLAVRMTAELKKLFGKNIALSSFYQGGTIEHVASLLRQSGDLDMHSSLVEIRTGGQQTPFFLVHPVAGVVHAFVELGRELGDRPIYGLQSRGVDDDQEPFFTVEEMAAHYLQAIQSVQPEGPYLLGGWSMGGAVAYEMAQLLQRQGEDVSFLALLDTHMPTAIPEEALPDIEYALMFAEDLARRFELDLSELYARKHELTEEQVMLYILEEAKQRDALPPQFGLTELQRFYNVFRANSEAILQYHPSAYDGAVTLYRAEQGTSVLSQDEVHGRTLGWGDLVSNLTVYDVPGAHLTMVHPPHVETLAEQLRQGLEAVEQKLTEKV